MDNGGEILKIHRGRFFKSHLLAVLKIKWTLKSLIIEFLTRLVLLYHEYYLMVKKFHVLIYKLLCLSLNYNVYRPQNSFETLSSTNRSIIMPFIEKNN